MSEAEVVRKVQSVCEKLGMSSWEAEVRGMVKIGDKLVALMPDEFVDNGNSSGFIPDRGEVFMVIRVDADGAPGCKSTQRDLRLYLSLNKMAFPEDYEAAYKGTQQPEKEEKVVESTEDQFEWILENTDKKPTKDLSAEELKELYDAMYSGDNMVIIEVLCDTQYTWHTTECHAPYGGTSYRVKRKVKDTPLTISWKWIDPKWNWAAMDGPGVVFLYEKQPKLGGIIWTTNWRGAVLEYNPPALIKDGIDWKRSLTKRP